MNELEKLLKKKYLKEIGNTKENKEWLDDKLIVVMPTKQEKTNGTLD
tara:strand:- start:148 stop:288 length:141 start_codon:yes stop_codon:yes gene_type:complete